MVPDGPVVMVRSPTAAVIGLVVVAVAISLRSVVPPGIVTVVPARTPYAAINIRPVPLAVTSDATWLVDCGLPVAAAVASIGVVVSTPEYTEIAPAIREFVDNVNV